MNIYGIPIVYDRNHPKLENNANRQMEFKGVAYDESSFQRPQTNSTFVRHERNSRPEHEKEIVNKNPRINDLVLSLKVKEELHNEEVEQLNNFIKFQGKQNDELEKQRRFAESTLYSVQTSVESANRGPYQELQQEKQTVQEWIKICEKQSEDITHYRSLWETLKSN
ncbi:unnamed protein product [Mytilus coruscus]|uniref:Uncharacterized protein n=1 Tax=Mytilus coruscus TaxID=42192 RepID=A0A6J8DCT3_MYTCO|nr:unnamed protein product [Mytilus coruscus]